MAYFEWNDPREDGYWIVFKNPQNNEHDYDCLTMEGILSFRRRNSNETVLCIDKRHKVFDDYGRGERLDYEHWSAERRKRFI